MKQNPPAHKVVGDEGAPGQIVAPVGAPRYLRDIIKKYQDEDKAQEPPEQRVAPYPCDNAEKRLQRVLTTLESLARQADARHGRSDYWWAQELRRKTHEVRPL